METLLKWKSTITTLGLAAITGVVLVFMSPETWTKVEHIGERVVSLVERVGSDPAGAVAMLTGLATVAAFLRGLWKRDPNAPRTETTTVTHVETGKPEEKS